MKWEDVGGGWNVWMTQSNFAAKGKADYGWEGKWSSRWENGREGDGTGEEDRRRDVERVRVER